MKPSPRIWTLVGQEEGNTPLVAGPPVSDGEEVRLIEAQTVAIQLAVATHALERIAEAQGGFGRVACEGMVLLAREAMQIVDGLAELQEPVV